MFGKKRTLDDILKDIDELSEEEKAKVKEKMDDLYKAEDEREIDKVEENKAENAETEDEKAEEVKEESKEIGKDVDETEKEVEKDEASEEGSEKAPAAETESTETAEATEDTEKTEGEAVPEWAKALSDRIAKIEAIFAAAETEDSAPVEKAKEIYGLGNGVFVDNEGEKPAQNMSAAQIKSILDKIKR